MAWVTEGLMHELNVDDRVMRRLPQLQAELHAKLEYVQNFSPFIWQRLSIIHRSVLHWDRLRTDCLLAAHTAAAFITNKIFAKANSLPWPLCTGDIE